MNVQELKIYYKKAWLSWFLFPNGLKAALSLVETKNKKDYDAYDRINEKLVCEWFEKGLQKRGILSWIFKKLYKKQIEEFLTDETYKRYTNKNLTETGKLDPNATLVERVIAAEKDLPVLSNYINEQNERAFDKQEKMSDTQKFAQSVQFWQNIRRQGVSQKEEGNESLSSPLLRPVVFK